MKRKLWVGFLILFLGMGQVSAEEVVRPRIPRSLSKSHLSPIVKNQLQFHVKSDGRIDQISSSEPKGSLLPKLSMQALMSTSTSPIPFSKEMKAEMGDGYWDAISFAIKP